MARAELAIRREMRVAQPRPPSPYRLRHKIMPFCAGLLMRKPLTEVALQGLKRGGLPEWQKALYLRRLEKSGNLGQVCELLNSGRSFDDDATAGYRAPGKNAGMVPYPKEKRLEMLKEVHQKSSDRKAALFLSAAALTSNLAGILSSLIFQSKWMIIPVVIPLASAVTAVFFSSMKKDKLRHKETRDVIEQNTELASLPGDMRPKALPPGRY